jgi:hypothetical protein
MFSTNRAFQTLAGLESGGYFTSHPASVEAHCHYMIEGIKAQLAPWEASSPDFDDSTDILPVAGYFPTSLMDLEEHLECAEECLAEVTKS